MRRARSSLSGLAALVLAVALPLAAAGDARTDRLVDLLANSGNYRVRVQSAQSLGRIRDPDTVPALVAALEDRHPAVIAAAAQSLGRIGESSALAPLERLARDTSQPGEVRRQAEQAAGQIRRMSRMSAPSTTARASSGKARFYVGVGDMGNTTGRRRGDLEKTLKTLVRTELGESGQIAVAPDGETPSQTKRALKANGMTGYYVQGSVTRLEKVGSQVQAVVSIMVLTNPDRNLRMMLQGRGAVGVTGGSVSASAQQDLENSALEAAVEGAVSRLAGQLTP